MARPSEAVRTSVTQSATDFAVLPERGSPLGLASWARELASVASVAVSPARRPAPTLPRGDGRTVLLIPGFFGGDWTMVRLRGFLTRLGYGVEAAGIAVNLGPTAAILARLESALLLLGRDHGPIDLVGQSLGGVFARELARKHTAHVRSLVTLCTPIRFPVITPLAPLARALAPFHDAAWTARSGEVAEPLSVPVTALYSRDDGILDWRQCLQDEGPLARNICVSGPHSTIGSNPQAQAAIARALASAA